MLLGVTRAVEQGSNLPILPKLMRKHQFSYRNCRGREKWDSPFEQWGWSCFWSRAASEGSWGGKTFYTFCTGLSGAPGTPNYSSHFCSASRALPLMLCAFSVVIINSSLIPSPPYEGDWKEFHVKWRQHRWICSGSGTGGDGIQNSSGSHGSGAPRASAPCEIKIIAANPCGLGQKTGSGWELPNGAGYPQERFVSALVGNSNLDFSSRWTAKLWGHRLWP